LQTDDTIALVQEKIRNNQQLTVREVGKSLGSGRSILTSKLGMKMSTKIELKS